MTSEGSRSVRVFVNAVGVTVPAGASILDAVRAYRESDAVLVESGKLLVTDSRGLTIGADARVSAGSIFRLLPVRKRGRSADADEGSED